MKLDLDSLNNVSGSSLTNKKKSGSIKAAHNRGQPNIFLGLIK